MQQSVCSPVAESMPLTIDVGGQLGGFGWIPFW
jgi:hypothetical protein